MLQSIGASSEASSFRIRGWIPSGPAALFGFRFSRIFFTSSVSDQLRRPGDVVWDAVRDGDDEAPPSSACLPSLLMMLSHTGDKLYLPPSLLRLGLRALMYMASFTPLSNHLGSVVNTSVLSNSTECWG